MSRVVITVSLFLLTLSTSLPAEDWYPSKWGKDDTIGAANLVTPERILAATKLVKTGKRYALGQVTSRKTPAFGTRSFELFAVSHGGVFDGSGEPYGANSGSATSASTTCITTAITCATFSPRAV